MNRHLARFIFGCGVISLPLILVGSFWNINALVYIGIGLLCIIVILCIIERFTSLHTLPGIDELKRREG